MAIVVLSVDSELTFFDLPYHVTLSYELWILNVLVNDDKFIFHVLLLNVLFEFVLTEVLDSLLCTVGISVTLEVSKTVLVDV